MGIEWGDTKLETQRNQKRERTGRLSFDCFNLKVRGDRVYCAKGYLLGRARDGSSDLLTILRGITLGACKNCKDFDGGEDELFQDTIYPEPLHAYETDKPS